MAQPPTVRDAVARILQTSGRTSAECVIGFTYRALAARVYDTDTPTPAQLSAVRRAVARLVADGKAERMTDRGMVSFGHPAVVDVERETHWRDSRDGQYRYPYRNPGGVAVERTPTDEDNAARAAWLHQQNGVAVARPDPTTKGR